MVPFVLSLLLMLSMNAVNAQKALPYPIMERPVPTGNVFEKILPKQVGLFHRITFKEPGPGLDGEALYRNGKEEIFMLFSLSLNKDDQKETMQTIFTETKQDALGELRTVSLKTDPAYIHLVGKALLFLRGLVVFIVSAPIAKKVMLWY